MFASPLPPPDWPKGSSTLLGRAGQAHARRQRPNANRGSFSHRTVRSRASAPAPLGSSPAPRPQATGATAPCQGTPAAVPPPSRDTAPQPRPRLPSSPRLLELYSLLKLKKQSPACKLLLAFSPPGNAVTARPTHPSGNTGPPRAARPQLQLRCSPLRPGTLQSGGEATGRGLRPPPHPLPAAKPRPLL